MRVLMVLIALVATPFLTSVAQGSLPAGKGGGECKDKHANNGNHYGWRNGQHDNCETPAPPPVLGSVQGTVFYDVSYDGVWNAGDYVLQNWLVLISGPVNTSMVTDAAGSYSFTGLPDGTYTICEAQRWGWIQTAPAAPSSCTMGLGYTVVITAGKAWTGLDFGNVG